MYDLTSSKSPKQNSGSTKTTTHSAIFTGPPNRPPLTATSPLSPVEKSSDHAAVQIMSKGTVVGGRPKGWAIGNSMGNHVSAYKLHKGAVEAALRGDDLDGSITRMTELADHLKQHPAYSTLKGVNADVRGADDRFTKLDATVAKLNSMGIDDNQKLSLLQEAGKHYLAVHEILPGAVAFNAPGGGNAEGQAFSVTEMKRIYDADKKNDHMAAIKKSFDLMMDDRVYKSIKDSSPEDVDAMMPGMGVIAKNGTLQDHLAAGHVHSIEAAAIAMGRDPAEFVQDLFGSRGDALAHYKTYIDPSHNNDHTFGAVLDENYTDKELDSANFAVNLALSSDGRRITGINSKPRPDSNLESNEGMGSHLTSWGTYDALMKKTVKGQTLEGAAEQLSNVAHHVNINRQISEKMTGLDGETDLVSTTKPHASLMALQESARTLMIAMNKTKGAAASNAVNNYKNEAAYLKLLNPEEQSIFASKPSKGQLSTAFHGLLDLSSLDVDPAARGTDNFEEDLLNSSKNKILAYARHTQTMLGVSPKAVDAAVETHYDLKTSKGIYYSKIHDAMKDPDAAINILNIFDDKEDIHKFADHISGRQPETKSNSDREAFVPSGNLDTHGLPSRATRSKIKSGVENLVEPLGSDKKEAKVRKKRQAKNSLLMDHSGVLDGEESASSDDYMGEYNGGGAKRKGAKFGGSKEKYDIESEFEEQKKKKLHVQRDKSID